ncbi:bacterial transferase hexapeptide [Paenibacillus sp. 32O-W]|jgi:UDP-3-O-[3-hydroxymyristoyl] glucosamine N-acyltransferase|uniref:N-acetyltransferase n=1 Tax=Paenibacillus sp. 32O-W TaxID=1695218 RepID=UPI00071FC826|nr:N-acetyltransferase [Paenibacillus sp. 32O-W]ALS29749.1 bacterial transferase hexapeptide [Paenibacillus sp. 32O-W]
MEEASVIYGKNVTLGQHVSLEPGVRIGDNVTIGNFVVVKSGTQIGDNVQIGDLCVLGKVPFHNKKVALKPSTELNPLVIGDHVKIGSEVVIYRGVTLEYDVLVGDMASIRERVSVGESSIIGRNVIVEPRTVIGRRVTIQTSSYITSDMLIEDQVFIGPCCSTSNDKYMGLGNYKHQGPVIKKHARIGNNATLLPGVIIGEYAVVGAGAVITKDVPEGQTFVGNPGRLLARGGSSIE